MLDVTHIPLSLYIHPPWCVQKCPYCDFNSHALRGELPEQAYLQALCQEIDQKLDLLAERPLHSIFIGGGTPSLLAAETYAQLFEHLRQRLAFEPNMEVTLEANPGASEQARFRAYRELGINRLSLGIQSFDAQQLRRLGRIHDSDQAHRAIEMAKHAGFTRFNLDLMFGLPEQNVDAAIADLQQACAYQPPHLSWYQLTLEPNTYFYHHPPVLPDEDHLWEIQEAGMAYLQQQGLERYEVSAYARAHDYARHNVNYWTFGDYLGIGAGAHTKLTTRTGEIIRQQNHKHPTRYQQQPTQPAAEQRVSASALPFEFMLNHLRLNRPLAFTDFEARTGLPRSVLTTPLQRAQAQGLLVADAEKIVVTPQGSNFLNDLLGLFLQADNA